MLLLVELWNIINLLLLLLLLLLLIMLMEMMLLIELRILLCIHILVKNRWGRKSFLSIISIINELKIIYLRRILTRSMFMSHQRSWVKNPLCVCWSLLRVNAWWSLWRHKLRGIKIEILLILLFLLNLYLLFLLLLLL